MKRLLLIVLMVFWVTSGCRKEPEPTPPMAPVPAPSSPAALESSEAKEATEAPANVAPKAPVLDQVALSALPKAPDAPLDLVARQVSQRCRPSDHKCEGYDRLAAKIDTDLARTKTLLGSGTDQQKRALRHALLRTRTPESDALLVKMMVRPTGALDDAVLESIRWRRTEAALPGLRLALSKSVGEDVIKAMETVGAIGSKDAVGLLKWALGEKRLQPYWGSACRGLARTVSTDSLDQVTRLGAALNATEGQSVGCRGAEVALRVFKSGSRLSANLGAKRVQDPVVAVHQSAEDPRFLRVRVVSGSENPCEAAEAIVTLRTALSRSGEPMVNMGLDPVAINDDGTVKDADVFLLQFDELVLKNGHAVSGTLHMDYRVSKEPRVIISGHFKGAYCGVR